MEDGGKGLICVNLVSHDGKKREWDKRICGKIVAEDFPELTKDIKP